MKTKPILFQPEMVTAILEGRKTQTTRIKFKCEVGDHLWVKETYWAMKKGKEIVRHMYLNNKISDLRKDERFQHDAKLNNCKWQLLPSIYMPKECSRILLEVTEVKRCRLQEITEEEAIQEGIEINPRLSTVESFASLWDSIVNKKPKQGWYKSLWRDNPEVTMIKFTVIGRGRWETQKLLGTVKPAIIERHINKEENIMCLDGNWKVDDMDTMDKMDTMDDMDGMDKIRVTKLDIENTENCNRLTVESELWTVIMSLNVGGDILTILSEEEKTARLDRIAKELTFAGREYILEIAKRIGKC